jgi:hypothetical protein
MTIRVDRETVNRARNRGGASAVPANGEIEAKPDFRREEPE